MKRILQAHLANAVGYQLVCLDKALDRFRERSYDGHGA